MGDLNIVRIDMETISRDILLAWAHLYCEIWKESPWNEDFWRPEMVIEDFRRETSKPHAAGYLAMMGTTVAGFTHGYSVSCDELRVITGNSKLDHLFQARERLFYVDELGVGKLYRGQGISMKLSHALIETVREQLLAGMVLRTDMHAHAARHVYQKLGFSELDVRDAHYPNRTYWFLVP